MIKNEAYKWWNNQIDRVTNKYSSPEVVLPTIARPIWSKICPIFLLFVLDEQDVQKYWESIHSITSLFGNDKNIPNPLNNFPGFITKLYRYRDLMIPKTVKACMNFIERFGCSDSSHFFLYQSPVFFLDPLIYFSTLIELHDQKHKMWKDFVENIGLIEAFFDLYSSFLNQVPASHINSWRHKYLIVRVLDFMVQDAIQCPRICNIAYTLTFCIIPLLSSGPLEISVELFRVLRRLLMTYHTSFSRDDLFHIGSSILTSLAETEIYPMAYRFVAGFRPSFLTAKQFTSIIMSRPITSLQDVEYTLMSADSQSALSILMYLCRMGNSSSIWHRACYRAISLILVKYTERSEIREWFLMFLRRSFIFVAMANSKQKYRTRCLLLCESFSLLNEMKQVWLQKAILSISSVLIANRLAPNYFRSLFGYGPSSDDLVLHEYESFVSNFVYLKTFPFDVVKGTLALPPSAEKFRKTTLLPKSSRVAETARTPRNSFSKSRPSSTRVKTPTTATTSAAPKTKKKKIVIKKASGKTKSTTRSGTFPFESLNSKTVSRKKVDA